MDNIAITLLVLAFGAIVGSFLSVCVYRIPLAREDCYPEGKTEKIGISDPPRSFCPKCRAQLRWYHNIPVLSWTFLGGKCAFCKSPISIRYPLVEMLSAFFAYQSFMHYGLTPTAGLVYVFCASLIVLSLIDYDFYILPNLITLPWIVIGIGVAAINQFFPVFGPPIVAGLTESALGILAGGGFLYLVSEVYLKLRKIEGLGMGDVKLLAATGALFGYEASLYTIFVGSLFGAIFGLTLILFCGRKMSQHIPFGPYLAFATVLYLFTGMDLVIWLSQGIALLLGTRT